MIKLFPKDIKNYYTVKEKCHSKSTSNDLSQENTPCFHFNTVCCQIVNVLQSFLTKLNGYDLIGIMLNMYTRFSILH